MIVVGLMSGTSMDGIDAAAAELAFEGDTLTLRPLGHESLPYSPGLRAALAGVLPPAPTTLGTVCRLDTQIGQEFAEVAARAATRVEADLVVSHGQTVFHWVEDGVVRGTLQLGQPAWVAERTGLPVVSDLRPADVAAGGQGAPLVSLFDVLLLGRGAQTRAALNLGGIANLTIVPETDAPLAFDAGPANALLDAAVERVTGGAEHRDEEGRRAARGRLHEGLLAVLREDPYYRRPPPKTTGKEYFNAAYLDAALTEAGPVGDDDLLATLAAHAAEVIGKECDRYRAAEVVTSGGGRENRSLMRALEDRLGPGRVSGIEKYGIPSEAKEAYAFAVLGFLAVHGLPGTVPSCTGARHPAVLGRITPGRRPLPAVSPAPVPPSRLRVL